MGVCVRGSLIFYPEGLINKFLTLMIVSKFDNQTDIISVILSLNIDKINFN